jgi:hypothetical protein
MALRSLMFRHCFFLRTAFLCTALVGLAPAAAPGGTAANGEGAKALAAIVHKASAVDNISASDLRRMLTGELRVWPDASAMVLIQQPDENPSQQKMLQLLLKTTPAGYNRQLLQIQFQGRQLPAIRILNSDANAIAFVWNVPGAISIVDAGAAAASAAHVKVLKVDGKLPGEKGYPLQ